MCSSRHSGYFFKEVYIVMFRPEIIITDQRTKWLSGERAVLFFVNLSKEHALVNLRSFFLVPPEFFFGHGHHSNFDQSASFSLGDQIVQPAPRGLKLLEF